MKPSVKLFVSIIMVSIVYVVISFVFVVLINAFLGDMIVSVVFSFYMIIMLVYIVIVLNIYYKYRKTQKII